MILSNSFKVKGYNFLALKHLIFTRKSMDASMDANDLTLEQGFSVQKIKLFLKTQNNIEEVRNIALQIFTQMLLKDNLYKKLICGNKPIFLESPEDNQEVKNLDDQQREAIDSLDCILSKLQAEEKNTIIKKIIISLFVTKNLIKNNPASAIDITDSAIDRILSSCSY